MKSEPAGFHEIEHTADWELEVWAPDLNSLFEQAARGMFTLCGMRWAEGPTRKRNVKIRAGDHESLLVGFLSELLYLYENEKVVYHHMNLQINELNLFGELEGSQVTALDKEIKAVTYHNLAIRKSNRGLEVRIVFDV